MSNFQTSKKYVEIDPTSIEITEPLDSAPKDRVYRFSNPRRRAGKESGFSKMKMEDLYKSILKTGLQQPILCRMVGKKIQLIAGERRLRCVLRIRDNEPLAFDIDTKSKRPPKEVYSTVSCRLVSADCSDEDALKLAMDENDKSAPLTAADHVHIVEHLVECGKTPGEIEVLLDKNPAWVNHYINFRTKLPKKAFAALMDNEIPPFTATKLMEYPEADREEIWENAAALLQISTRSKKEAITRQIEETRIQVEVAEANLACAEDADLTATDIKKAKKNVARAEEKLEVAEKVLTDFKEAPPSISGSMIIEAAEKLDTKPLTPRALNRKKIQQHYIDPLWDRLENDNFVDEETGESFPKEVLDLAMTISDSIARQETDVFKALRGHMVDTGVWKSKASKKR